MGDKILYFSGISLNDDFINIKEVFSSSKFEFGKNDKEISANGVISFKEAVKDAKSKKIDILITAPINKSLSYSSSFKFSGHTDYLKNTFNIDPMMLMVSDKLKLGLLTDHIPLKDVVSEINTNKVHDLIKNNIISGGMIPKIKNCLDVASNGVKGVCIIDGRLKHSILFELLSDEGSGTLIRK